MKKFKTTLTLTLLAVLPVFAERHAVFLKTGGTGDGSSPESAVGTFDDAFAAMDDDGGTIVLCGPFSQISNYPVSTLRKHTGVITITSSHDGIDYRQTSGAEWTVPKGMRFQLGGPVRFADLSIRTTATSNNFLLVICNFNEFTMDQGVTASGFNYAAIGTALTIMGGCQDNLKNACGVDPRINIKGGEARIVAFNRGSGCGTAQSPGTAYINISGGIIHNVFTGSHTKDVVGGNVEMTVSGGKFVDHIYGGKYTSTYLAGGTQKLTVTGGDFSECKRIYFSKYNEEQTVDIDISGAGAAEFPLLVKINQINNIDRLSTNYMIPGKEFGEGAKFTASNGITIPYRIYLPAGNDTQGKFPLLTYLHDNGSRGTDNISHMYTQGSACLYTYLNFGDPCIIVAPQCPEEYVKDNDNIETMWMEKDKYVAGPNYDPEGPQTDYLAAASELIDHIVSIYNVDKERLYLGGASNGAGACWDLIVRNPGKFAAAIPVAGGGRDVTEERALKYGAAIAKTSVWTFHGDADTTLPINGTVCLVNAAKASGAKDMTFTIVNGGTHNIWNDAALTPGLAEWMFSKKQSISSTPEIGNSGSIRIQPLKGGVSFESMQPVNVTIFTAAGCKVAEFKCIGSHIERIGMSGIYIVVTDSGSTSSTTKITI